VSELRFVRMGFGAEAVEYQTAWDEQRRVHAARFADEIPDTVLLLEHPPVYTAGRRTADSERPLDGTPVIDVDRAARSPGTARASWWATPSRSSRARWTWWPMYGAWKRP